MIEEAKKKGYTEAQYLSIQTSKNRKKQMDPGPWHTEPPTQFPETSSGNLCSNYRNVEAIMIIF